MSRTLHRHWQPLLAVLILLAGGLLSQCILLPEEALIGESVANLRPIVRITAGVVADSMEAESRVHFHWYGADADGVVRRFEWAIDDTVTERAWTWINGFDADIPFLATTPQEGREFDDWHTFFVRAVDNEGARSAPDRRYFNTRTIAPSTEIISPEPVVDARWASTLRITWRGEDLDGSRADQLPEWFEYKLVRFESSPNPGNLAAIKRAFRDSANVFLGGLSRDDFPADSLGDYFVQARRAWLRVDGTSVDHTWLRGLDVGKTYGFAIRAIDEAGAVEPDFQQNKNWVLFRVGNERIRVTVCEPALGCETFNNFTFQRIWSVSVAPGQLIRFRWEGDASLTGSQPGSSNYGFNIPDPDDDSFRDANGIGGWIGWGNWTQMREAFAFPSSAEGSTHYFFLKMRDVTNLLETETNCTVEIRVSKLSFTRKFLIVDDLFRAPQPCSGSPPYDQETDEHRLRLLGDTIAEFLPPGEQWSEFSAFGDELVGAPARLPDTFLDTLGTFQNVIWDAGSGQRIGLNDAISRGTLARYVGAGGNLLLFVDSGPVSHTTDCRHTQVDPCCPCVGSCVGHLWTRGGGFLWDLLNLRGCVDKPRHPSGSAREMAPLSMIRARALHPLYPDLALDPDRWNCAALQRGLLHFEGLVANEDEPEDDPWYGREVARGNMELLYEAAVQTRGTRTDSIPVAWRTPGAAQAQSTGGRGRVVNFSFHPYYFAEENTRIAMSRALRWVVSGEE